MKLSRLYLGALLVGALLCAPTSAQVVTIIDFGSVNETPGGAFQDDNGDPLPDGLNMPYTETIPGGDASDPAPVAFNGFSPNNINPFNVVVDADLLADPPLEVEAPVLNGGATLVWTNVTSWNSDVATGHAGSNFFSAVDGLGPTTFTITTADPGDTVVLEAIGSFERDALVTYGGTSGTPGVYSPGTAWTMIGSSTGTATGTLEVANVPGGGAPEGNVGAFRITITPATGGVLKGDVDLDGTVTFLDINPFINVLSSTSFQAEADCDCNGEVTFLDIQPFIDILAGN